MPEDERSTSPTAQCLTVGEIEIDLDGNCVTCGAAAGSVCAVRLSATEADLPPIDKVIAALKIGHKYLGPDDVDLAAAAWLERLNSPVQCAPQPEPVAWRWQIHGIWHYAGGFPVSGAEPLYLHPYPTERID